MQFNPKVTNKRTLEGYQNFINNHLKDNFDYSKSVYVNAKTPMEILCRTCGRVFKQNPNNHKISGCKHCSTKALADSQRRTKAEFIQLANEVHGQGTYDYTYTEYINNSTKVKIVCPEHGEFEQIPTNHINNRQGCPKCGSAESGLSKRLDFTEFVTKANLIHCNMYYYHSIDYSENRSKVIATCPIHGLFKQATHLHLKGCGCPSCNIGTFNPIAKTILYYLSIDYNGNTYYKVGITSKSINIRYTKEELSIISVIEEIEFSTGAEAYQMEQRLLLKYKDYLYRGPKILLSGNTEILIKDISIDFINLKEKLL